MHDLLGIDSANSCNVVLFNWYRHFIARQRTQSQIQKQEITKQSQNSAQITGISHFLAWLIVLCLDSTTDWENHTMYSHNENQETVTALSQGYTCMYVCMYTIYKATVTRGNLGTKTVIKKGQSTKINRKTKTKHHHFYPHLPSHRKRLLSRTLFKHTLT